MPVYLIVNRAPEGFKPSSNGAAAWKAWFDELGAHLVNRGNPVFERTTLGNCDTGFRLGGYTLISAEDLDEAAALATSHPLLRLGGGVEVGQLTLRSDEQQPLNGSLCTDEQ